jgi:predicted NBD/HSP70 family sugar kinase
MNQQKRGVERGHNATRIRAFNARMILGIVRAEREISRADIARQTGLSPPAVSAIMAELEGEGYVEKKSRRSGCVGTPSTLYGLRRGSAYSVGLHIGRRSTSAVLLDLTGEAIQQAEFAYSVPRVSEVTAFIHATLETWHRALPNLPERIVGAGICTPKFFEYAAEDIGFPETISEEWAIFDAASAFVHLPKKLIFEENDVNAAALAELEWGHGTDVKNFFYINIGTFVGGGLVLGGRLLRGPQGLAATFGPFPVAPSGLVSAARTHGDFDYLFRRASLYVLLDHLRHGGIAVEQETELAGLDETCAPLVAEWAMDAAGALAQAIQGVAAIIDVEAIIIDSSLPREILSALICEVRAQLDLNANKMIVKPKILMGDAGERPSARGAAMVPFGEVLGIGTSTQPMAP